MAPYCLTFPLIYLANSPGNLPLCFTPLAWGNPKGSEQVADMLFEGLRAAPPPHGHSCVPPTPECPLPPRLPKCHWVAGGLSLHQELDGP